MSKKDKKDPVRYHLVLPPEVYEELKNVASDRHTTVVHLIRQFIKLGLTAIHSESQGASLEFRQGSNSQKIVLL